MKRFLLNTILATAIAAPAGANQLSLESNFSGVTWDRDRHEASHNAPLAGLHIADDGRRFVTTPRWITSDIPASLNLFRGSESGLAQLEGWPSASVQSVDAPAPEALRNVLGFHVDELNGWLWALDMGFVSGEQKAPVGGQKVVIFDLVTGMVVRSVMLDDVADRAGSFLNDIVVDEEERIAYIADSGFRSAPDNQTALIVYDYGSNEARRVLHQHRSTQISDVPVMSHGEPVWNGNRLNIGVNGLALSQNADRLYWAVTTGHDLYSAPTEALRDNALGTVELAEQVRLEATLGFNTDGLTTDSDGTLLITNVSENGIARFNPDTRAVEMVASDPKVFWPDTVTLGPDGTAFVTSSNTSDHFAGQIGPGEEAYRIWRLTRD